ncbi:MAG TPA: Dabb family protein [Acidimicrobiia bacterium]|jgi:hypothetical protein
MRDFYEREVGMSFRHIVLLHWKEGTDAAAHDAVVEGLCALPAQIPELRHYKVGGDAGLNPANYDLAVVADFDDEAGYVVYRDHPAHRKVIDERITPILAERAAVQHET